MSTAKNIPTYFGMQPLSTAISSNSFNIAGASGTSSFKSSMLFLSLVTPFATWNSETIAFPTRKANKAAIASIDGSECVEAPLFAPSSSIAIFTPRLTSSWWKCGALSSLTQRAASSSSRESKYSY